ncbi:MAG: Asp-tRNA(Asn)/Glu-tRNA(Gln) amidotransferase subunit GatA [Clostridiales bacterium]|nr:Asp-tRNA(Asn)/Glu-tRNA(Gln) amidotransferase subunit GatA [Clostridiales bacterium]
MNNNGFTSAAELAENIHNGKISSVAAVTECLNTIRESAHLNNFITVCESEAMIAAERIDADIKSGKCGTLTGVPVAVKDNICTKGIKTTCASKLFSDYVPDSDASVISRLKKAGAIIIGKANMDEFAFGSSNEYSAYGVVHNARDNTKVAGGSSGGSANAVAARQVPLAIGTDTGGSVRQPAAFCGVVGLKPTYGAIDRSGVVGLCPSMEQVGTFSNDCDDALLLFSVLSGRENACRLDGNVCGKTIGVAKEFLQAEMSESVKNAFTSATEKLKENGASIVEVSVPSFFAGLAAYHVLSSAEAVDSFRKIIKSYPHTELLGEEVKRRMLTGAIVLSGDNYENLYIKAAKVRTVIKAEYDNALMRCDALLCPVTATAALPIGGITDPHQSHMCDSFLAPVSLAGLPAVSVPFGSEHGLPLGVQIIGRRNAEYDILNIGKALTAS